MKVTPEIQDDKVVCIVRPYIWNPGGYTNKCSVCNNQFNNGVKMQRVCESCCENSFEILQTLPEHEAYFRENLGNVVECEIKIYSGFADGLPPNEPPLPQPYAFPTIPKVDLWDVADMESDQHAIKMLGIDVTKYCKDEFLLCKMQFLKDNYTITRK